MHFNFLTASSVSAIAGRHKYKDGEVEILKLIKRYNKNLYKKITKDKSHDIIRHNIQKEEEEECQVRNELKSEANEFYENIISKENLDQESLKQLDILKKQSKNNIDKAVYENILIKDRGTRLETSVTDSDDLLNMMKQKFGEHITIVKPGKAYKKYLASDKYRYQIYGYVDALVIMGNKVLAVLEIKTRKNHFFEPQYDIDQLLTYLKLTDVDEGYLIQKCNGKIKCSDAFYKNQWGELKCDLDRAINKFNDTLNFDFYS